MLMRNFTLFVLCAALAVPASQASLSHVARAKKHMPAALVQKKAETSKKKHAARAAEAAAKWCALTQKAFGWDGEEWQLEETYAMTYDQVGNVLEQEVTDYDGYINREVNTWNDNNLLATRISTVAESADADFENYGKLSRSYDDKVPTFITVNEQYRWDGDQWEASNYYTQTVTRDAAGNVTAMERAVYFQGVLDPTYRLTVTYGADGKAETIKDSNLQYDYSSGEYEWVDASLVSDIVWETTDGQILDAEDLFAGANRVKSATVTDLEFGDVYYYTAEYAADGSYTVTMNMHDDYWDEDAEAVMTYTPLDANGSYKVVNVETYIADGEPYYSTTVVQTGKYDAYGLILLEEVTYDGEVDERTVGTVEYDTEHGYPLTWTVQVYDIDEDEMINAFRAEYSDYIDAGVADALIDSTDAPVEYFNLQGMRVDNPAAGNIYIRRQGNTATKVLVK